MQHPHRQVGCTMLCVCDYGAGQAASAAAAAVAATTDSIRAQTISLRSNHRGPYTAPLTPHTMRLQGHHDSTTICRGAVDPAATPRPTRTGGRELNFAHRSIVGLQWQQHQQECSHEHQDSASCDGELWALLWPWAAPTNRTPSNPNPKPEPYTLRPKP